MRSSAGAAATIGRLCGTVGDAARIGGIDVAAIRDKGHSSSVGIGG
jgi:hypothetical protein